MRGTRQDRFGLGRLRGLVSLLVTVVLSLFLATPAAAAPADPFGALSPVRSASQLARQAATLGSDGMLFAESIGNSGLDEAAVSSVTKFNYTGAVQTFTAPYTGEYLLHVWGAQGGSGNETASKSLSSHPGWGGEAQGRISLTQGQKLYVFVGGQGAYGAGSSAYGGPVGGWNGGGNGGTNTSGSGGGMTHISTRDNPVTGTSWNTTGTLIVAGGGGGADNPSTSATGPGHDDGSGGDGGGAVAGAGYVDGTASSNSYHDAESSNGGGCGMGGNTTLGKGYARGKGESVSFSTDTGGGGGGWYSGYVSNHNNGGAGGGSGYIGGVTGGSMSNGTRTGNGYAEITLANELIVDPNGGSWVDGNGSPHTDPQSYRQIVGTMNIANPTRNGYRFVGWAEVGTGKLTTATGTSGDGAFSTGSNGILAYNENMNGALTAVRVSSSTSPFGTSVVRLTHDATHESVPQLGGFSVPSPLQPGNTYRVTFSAKIPAGYYAQAMCSTTDDYEVTWLTDQKGTGEFRTYAYEVKVKSTTPHPLDVRGAGYANMSAWTRNLAASNRPVLAYDTPTEMNTLDFHATSGWETVSSGPISVTANARYRLEFDYKTLMNYTVFPSAGWFGLSIQDYANPVSVNANIPTASTLAYKDFNRTQMDVPEHVVLEFTAPASGKVYLTIPGGQLTDETDSKFSVGSFDSRTSVYLTRDPLGTPETEAGTAAAEAMSWDVAYAEMNNVTGATSFNFTTGASRIIAQWEPIEYKVHYHYQNDDDYKAGQADTLGATMDMGRNNRITGNYKTTTSSAETLLIATTDGENGLRVSSTNNHVSVTDGTTTATIPNASDASSGASFLFDWNSAGHEAYITSGTTSEGTVARQTFADVPVPVNPPDPLSEDEVRIGSADWADSYAPVHASDMVWTVPYGVNETFSMPHPTRIGYTFLGWATTPTGAVTYAANQNVSHIVNEGETHLYARWALRSYNVIFDANGGAGGMPSQEFQWNEQKALSHNTILRFNWRFTGWNTEPDGSGTAYLDEQVVRNILERPVVTDNDYNITLYAQWEKVNNATQVDEGVWEVDVPANGRLIVNNLPAGASYEVTELPKQDWVLLSQENTSGAIVPRTTQTSRFLNEYRPGETSLALSATKLLDGAAPLGSDYSFTLSRVDGENMTFIETVSNNGRGIQFSPLTYTQADIGSTITYVIQEAQGDDPNIRYDPNPKTVTVSVTTGTTGLVAEATYPDLDGVVASAIFSNTTKPGSLRVSKDVTGATDKALEVNGFPVTVTLTDALGEPVAGDFPVSVGDVPVAGASFGADGSVTVTLKDDDVLLISGIPAGTRYSVSETYPSWFRQASATGTSGVIAPDATSDAAFVNEYSASGTAVVTASKRLLGGALQKDEFSFRLLDSEGDVVGNATCEADGTISFPAIAYGASDDGKTYSYVIEEIDDGREDVAYDTVQKPVTVTVGDLEGKGELDVSVSYGTPTGATFDNKMLVEVPDTGQGGIWAIVAAGTSVGLVVALAAASERIRLGSQHGGKL